MTFRTELKIDYPRRAVVEFFRNPEVWFRLNPEWDVRNYTRTADDTRAFSLEVIYDRSEQRAVYRGLLKEREGDTGLVLALDGEEIRRLQLTFAGPADRVHGLVMEELDAIELEPRRQTELVLWLKSIGDYLAISNRPGYHWRLVRFLLDKIWLRLTPTGRRVVFLVLAFELLGLVFIFALLAVKHMM